MKTRFTFKTILELLKMTSTPIFTWPLPADASRKTILKRNIYRAVAVIHTTILTGFIIYDICSSITHDIEHGMAIFAELTAALATITAITLCHVEEARFRGLLDEIHSFMNRANEEELDIIQTYVDKRLGFHTIIFATALSGPPVYILGAIAMKQPLPLTMEYPYAKDSTLVFAMTFLSQVIGIIQAASAMTFDCFFAMLIWYTGARMEMSAKQLGRATNCEEVKRCIREHQHVLEYVKELKIPVRVFISLTMIIILIAVIACGLLIMIGPSMFIIVKFTIVEIVSVMRLFLFAWPADHLMNQGKQVAVAAYNCKWIGQSPGMMKDLIFVVHKAQTPVVLDVPGLTPAFTIEFYASIMKGIFSYLMTLHAMLEN